MEFQHNDLIRVASNNEWAKAYAVPHQNPIDGWDFWVGGRFTMRHGVPLLKLGEAPITDESNASDDGYIGLGVNIDGSPLGPNKHVKYWYPECDKWGALVDKYRIVEEFIHACNDAGMRVSLTKDEEWIGVYAAFQRAYSIDGAKLSAERDLIAKRASQ